MNECYFGTDSCSYGVSWQCRTCEEWYCLLHWHQTELGANVECVACERNRKDQADESQTTRKAPPIVIHMYGGLIQDIENPYGQIEIHVLEDVYKDDTGDDEMHEYLHALDFDILLDEKVEADQAHPILITIW